MPTFQPPTADTVSPVYAGEPDPVRPTHPLARRLFRHFKLRACGRTVLKIDGEYATYDNPLDTDVARASEVYLGGHVYSVSDDVAAALTAAGYGDGVS